MKRDMLLLATDSYLCERALADAHQASAPPIWNVLPDPVRANNRYENCWR